MKNEEGEFGSGQQDEGGKRAKGESDHGRFKKDGGRVGKKRMIVTNGIAGAIGGVSCEKKRL